jgi:hypothetical protein
MRLREPCAAATLRRRRTVIELVARPSKSEGLAEIKRNGNPSTGSGEGFPRRDQPETEDHQEQPKHVRDLCSRMRVASGSVLSSPALFKSQTAALLEESAQDVCGTYEARDDRPKPATEFCVD